MPRLLIIYATREGQTAKVAGRLAAHLEQAGAEVRTVCAADDAALAAVDLAAFDRLVFGASLHAGGLEPELVRFVNAHAQAIGRRPRSFFLVLLSAATRDPQLRETWLADARAKLASQVHVSFEHVEMIAGALRYSKYPPPLRWVMRRIAAKAGGDTDTSRDYEYTDWQQVAEYAAQLLRA